MNREAAEKLLGFVLLLIFFWLWPAKIFSSVKMREIEAIGLVGDFLFMADRHIFEGHLADPPLKVLIVGRYILPLGCEN